jgi:hypothetical protein
MVLFIGLVGLGSFHFRIKSEPFALVQHKYADVNLFILQNL